MTRVTNFGDPNFEPTDEELGELMHEAFADVPARSAAALAQIRQESRNCAHKQWAASNSASVAPSEPVLLVIKPLPRHADFVDLRVG